MFHGGEEGHIWRESWPLTCVSKAQQQQGLYRQPLPYGIQGLNSKTRRTRIAALRPGSGVIPLPRTNISGSRSPGSHTACICGVLPPSFAVAVPASGARQRSRAVARRCKGACRTGGQLRNVMHHRQACRAQARAEDAEGGVGVGLEEVQGEAAVEQEVKAEQLAAVLQRKEVQRPGRCGCKQALRRRNRSLDPMKPCAECLGLPLMTLDQLPSPNQ